LNHGFIGQFLHHRFIEQFLQFQYNKRKNQKFPLFVVTDDSIKKLTSGQPLKFRAVW
jgi:hypothetical protein